LDERWGVGTDAGSTVTWVSGLVEAEPLSRWCWRSPGMDGGSLRQQAGWRRAAAGCRIPGASHAGRWLLFGGGGASGRLLAWCCRLAFAEADGGISVGTDGGVAVTWVSGLVEAEPLLRCCWRTPGMDGGSLRQQAGWRRAAAGCRIPGASHAGRWLLFGGGGASGRLLAGCCRLAFAEAERWDGMCL
jgi:hypothetical protein